MTKAEIAALAETECMAAADCQAPEDRECAIELRADQLTTDRGARELGLAHLPLAVRQAVATAMLRNKSGW